MIIERLGAAAEERSRKSEFELVPAEVLPSLLNKQISILLSALSTGFGSSFESTLCGLHDQLPSCVTRVCTFLLAKNCLEDS